MIVKQEKFNFCKFSKPKKFLGQSFKIYVVSLEFWADDFVTTKTRRFSGRYVLHEE